MRRTNRVFSVAIAIAFVCAFLFARFSLSEEIPHPGSPINFPQPRPVNEVAGAAFAGRVTSVEHIAAVGNNRIATTRITLRVETPIRGVRSGQTLVINEWAGLWSSGERYRPGERVCLFLYPPSKLGLTSPVHGQAGRFRVEGPRVVLPPGQRGILPSPIRTKLDEDGRISLEEFARALRDGGAR